MADEGARRSHTKRNVAIGAGAVVLLAAIGTAGAGRPDVSPSPSSPAASVAAAASSTPSPTPTVAPTVSACEQDLAAAAAVPDTQDTVTDLDPAIRDCPSLAEFARIAASYPAALDAGVDATVFVTNRCQDATAGLAGAALCAEVAP